MGLLYLRIWKYLGSFCVIEKARHWIALTYIFSHLIKIKPHFYVVNSIRSDYVIFSQFRWSAIFPKSIFQKYSLKLVTDTTHHFNYIFKTLKSLFTNSPLKIQKSFFNLGNHRSNWEGSLYCYELFQRI